MRSLPLLLNLYKSVVCREYGGGPLGISNKISVGHVAFAFHGALC
jgi:hypothetical protein